MKKLLCLMGILVLVMVVVTTTANDQDFQKALQSQEVLLAESEIPRAFQGIDLVETLPISDAQAQEIRGTAWPIVVPFLYLIGHYVGVYGPKIFAIYEYLSQFYDAGVAIAEIIAFW